MFSNARYLLAGLAVATLVLAACEDDITADAGGSASQASEGKPTVVVTTNILGDVVTNLVGDLFEVVTIMPVGADPHDFQASAQQANQIRQADALITNGAGFEETLLDVIEAAEGDGVPTFAAISAVETIEFGEGGHNEHPDDEHPDEHEGGDPHFFTDPARMSLAAQGIVEFLVDTVDGVDADALEASAADYIAELDAVDANVEETLSSIADANRVLITNHEVFGYFADRYDFEVAGTVVPSGSTTDGASAGALAGLAELVRDEGVPAIFADTSSSDDLAQTLADEVGATVEVVELFSESLGEAGSDGATYLAMMRTNAERIAGALA